MSLRENCPYLDFSGPYFPAFSPNPAIYGPKKPPNTDTFSALRSPLEIKLVQFLQ